MIICIQSPPRLPMMQDRQSLTCRWLSCSGWGRLRVSTVFGHEGGRYIRKGHWLNNVNILRFVVEYLNETINRTTRNIEPEIGTDRSHQTQQNLWVEGYGFGFGPPRRSALAFGLLCNQTKPCVRSEPELLVSFPHPLLTLAGRHCELQWRFGTIVWCTGIWYLGGFCDFPMAERDISANAEQQACGVSWMQPSQSIKWGSPLGRKEKWKCTPWCTSSTQGSPPLSSSWLSSSFEVVADQVFYKWCGCITHVCGNGQWWTHRNATQIPGFMRSFSVRHYTQGGQDMSKSYSSIPWGNKTEVLGIEAVVPGICTSCPAQAKQSTI